MTVVQISSHPRFNQEREPEVGKKTMADLIGFSTKWIELRHHDGLPSRLAANGTRRYVPSEVEAWVSEWMERSGANGS